MRSVYWQKLYFAQFSATTLVLPSSVYMARMYMFVSLRVFVHCTIPLLYPSIEIAGQRLVCNNSSMH